MTESDTPDLPEEILPTPILSVTAEEALLTRTDNGPRPEDGEQP